MDPVSRNDAAPPGRRCAIVQFEAVHEETAPSLIRALNALGYTPDIFLNARCRAARGDIFAEIDGIEARVAYVPLEARGDWDALRETVTGGDFEFLVLNTFQRDGIARWAGETGLPLLGVVHNTALFLASAASVELARTGRAGLICLAPHVAQHLEAADPGIAARTGVVEPLYWGRVARPRRAAADWADRPPQVAIPGGVSFRTRAFEALIAALARSGASAGPVFHVLGGGPDRDRLDALIDRHGLGHRVRTAPTAESGRVLYADYFAGLRAADLLLPLLPDSFHDYRENKITSAVPTGLGFLLPLVLDSTTARIYRVPALVTGASVEENVEALASLDAERYNALLSAICRYRSERAYRNILALRTLLRGR